MTTENEDIDEELDRIERRLDYEKYFSDTQIDVVMAVIEEEMLGETDRRGQHAYMTETGSIRYEDD